MMKLLKIILILIILNYLFTSKIKENFTYSISSFELKIPGKYKYNPSLWRNEWIPEHGANIHNKDQIIPCNNKNYYPFFMHCEKDPSNTTKDGKQGLKTDCKFLDSNYAVKNDFNCSPTVGSLLREYDRKEAPTHSIVLNLKKFNKDKNEIIGEEKIKLICDNTWNELSKFETTTNRTNTDVIHKIKASKGCKIEYQILDKKKNNVLYNNNIINSKQKIIPNVKVPKSKDDTHQVNEDFFKEFEIKPVVWFIPKGFFQETDEQKNIREQCLKIATVNEMKNSDCNIYHPEIRNHLNSLKAKEKAAEVAVRSTNSIRNIMPGHLRRVLRAKLR